MYPGKPLICLSTPHLRSNTFLCTVHLVIVLRIKPFAASHASPRAGIIITADAALPSPIGVLAPLRTTLLRPNRVKFRVTYGTIKHYPRLLRCGCLAFRGAALLRTDGVELPTTNNALPNHPGLLPGTYPAQFAGLGTGGDLLRRHAAGLGPGGDLLRRHAIGRSRRCCFRGHVLDHSAGPAVGRCRFRRCGTTGRTGSSSLELGGCVLHPGRNVANLFLAQPAKERVRSRRRIDGKERLTRAPAHRADLAWIEFGVHGGFLRRWFI